MISHDLAVLVGHLRPARGDVRGPRRRGGPRRPRSTRTRDIPYGKALSAAFPRIGDPASRFAPRGLPGDPPDPSALPDAAARSTRAARWRSTAASPRTRSCGPRPRTGGRPVCTWAGGHRSGRRRRRRARGAPPHDQHGRPCSAAGALHVTFPGRRGADRRARRGRRRPRHRARARSSRWSASPAAARRRSPAPCSAWSRRRPARVTLRGDAARLLRAGPQGVPQARAAGPPGPERLAQPAAHGVRRGGRGACASTGTRATSASAVASALSRAGLRPPERFFLRYPHELSGGQRQRVVIAGALVLEPN